MSSQLQPVITGNLNLLHHLFWCGHNDWLHGATSWCDQRFVPAFYSSKYRGTQTHCSTLCPLNALLSLSGIIVIHNVSSTTTSPGYQFQKKVGQPIFIYEPVVVLEIYEEVIKFNSIKQHCCCKKEKPRHQQNIWNLRYYQRPINNSLRFSTVPTKSMYVSISKNTVHCINVVLSTFTFLRLFLSSCCGVVAYTSLLEEQCCQAVLVLQGCLGGWLLSTGIYMKVRNQSFPAHYCTVAR